MVINYTSKRSVTLTAKLLTIEEEEIVFATATKHQRPRLTLLLGVTFAHLPLGHTANDQERIRVTKVTNVTARPLSQC